MRACLPSMFDAVQTLVGKGANMAFRRPCIAFGRSIEHPERTCMKPSTKRRDGNQLPTPPRGAKAPRSPAGLALPHERDESIDAPPAEIDPKLAQAKRDIDAGLVDTDMRATPGLDARRRADLVPGPGGKGPARRP